jgi:hypothetical protein
MKNSFTRPKKTRKLSNTLKQLFPNGINKPVNNPKLPDVKFQPNFKPKKYISIASPKGKKPAPPIDLKV